MQEAAKNISFDDLISNLTNKNFKILDDVNFNTLSNEEINKLKEILKKDLKSELLIELKTEVKKELNLLLSAENNISNDTVKNEKIKVVEKIQVKKPIKKVKATLSSYERSEHLSKSVHMFVMALALLLMPMLFGFFGILVGSGSSFSNGSIQAATSDFFNILRLFTFIISGLLAGSALYHLIKGMD